MPCFTLLACFSPAVSLLLLIMKMYFRNGYKNFFDYYTICIGFRELILTRFLSTNDHHAKIKAKTNVYNVISCPFYVTSLFLYPLKHQNISGWVKDWHWYLISAPDEYNQELAFNWAPVEDRFRSCRQFSAGLTWLWPVFMSLLGLSYGCKAYFILSPVEAVPVHFIHVQWVSEVKYFKVCQGMLLQKMPQIGWVPYFTLKVNPFVHQRQERV